MEFEKLNVSEKKSIQATKDNWKPPPEDIYKVNIDGAIDPKTRTGGWGFVVRNNHGELLAAGVGKINYAASALHIEAMAAYKGLLFASQMGMPRIILEMDASVLASALKANEIDQSGVRGLIRQAQQIMRFEFSSCVISNCSRCCNKVADGLATYGVCMLSSDTELLISQSPECVSELGAEDLPQRCV